MHPDHYFYQGAVTRTTPLHSFRAGLRPGRQNKFRGGINPAGIYVFADPQIHVGNEVSHEGIDFGQEMQRFAIHVQEDIETWKRELSETGSSGQGEVTDKVFRRNTQILTLGHTYEKAANYAVGRLLVRLEGHDIKTKPHTWAIPSVVVIKPDQIGNFRLLPDNSLPKGSYLLIDCAGTIINHIPPSAIFVVSLSVKELEMIFEESNDLEEIMPRMETLLIRKTLSYIKS